MYVISVIYSDEDFFSDISGYKTHMHLFSVILVNLLILTLISVISVMSLILVIFYSDISFSDLSALRSPPYWYFYIPPATSTRNSKLN